MQDATGIDVTLTELIAMRQQALLQPSLTPLHKLKQIGQHQTRSRGRGIELDTTREYQPGDDIRHMAWRVTARSQKPHTKMYHEEKERPVWLGLDLSPSLFFGTRSMFKSVRLLKQAACFGWTQLLKGERIGAVLTSPHDSRIFRPKASEAHFLSILHACAASSCLSPSFSEPNQLHALLQRLQEHIRSDNHVVVFSDFADLSSANQKLLQFIAIRAQLSCVFVYDPFEAEAPPPDWYVVTNGQQQHNFKMHDARNRLHYHQQFAEKQALLTTFCRRHAIPFHSLRTDRTEIA